MSDADFSRPGSEAVLDTTDFDGLVATAIRREDKMVIRRPVDYEDDEERAEVVRNLLGLVERAGGLDYLVALSSMMRRGDFCLGVRGFTLREGREAAPWRCPHPLRFCFRFRSNSFFSLKTISEFQSKFVWQC